MIDDILGIDPESEPLRRIERDGDGFLYDADTGEITGHSEATDSFKIDTNSAADWALSLRADIEANIVALDAKERAILANLQGLRRSQERRLEWWDRRFKPDLVDFTRGLLAGGKRKTARFAYGAVSFRATAGTNAIVDMPRAVEYVELVRPRLVKVQKSVTVDAVLQIAEERGDATPTGWFKSSGPGETVKIATGIGG